MDAARKQMMQAQGSAKQERGRARVGCAGNCAARNELADQSVRGYSPASE